MPAASQPRIEVFAARLNGDFVDGVPPTRDDWSNYFDITQRAKARKVQRRLGVALDRAEVVTLPDNRSNPDVEPIGTPANPLLESDDLIKVVSYRDPASGDAEVLFEGFVVAPGTDVRVMGPEKYTNRQTIDVLSVGVRMHRDQSRQVYGQRHTDPTDLGNAEIDVFGGPPPDHGQTVFNPDGRPNYDTIYSGLSTWWDAFPIFTWPSAVGSGFWSIGNAIAYICGVYNGDEDWVLNPPTDLLEATGQYATDYARMGNRVPPNTAVSGLSFLEALETLCKLGRFDFAVLVSGDATTTSHQIEIWPKDAGRADKYVTLQAVGGNFNPLFGSENNTETGTNIAAIQYTPDLDGVQNKVIGVGGIEKFHTTFTLAAWWDAVDNPAEDISDANIEKYYTSKGPGFLTSGFRKVFRRWSANMDGVIGTDGFGVEINPTNSPLDLSSIFGYQNVGRPRVFGKLPIGNELTTDETMQVPVVEWTTDGGTWEPLGGASIRFHPEGDSIQIGRGDLRSMIHSQTKKSFWDAAVERLAGSGSLALRVSASISGDRRVRSIPTKSLVSPTNFELGRVFDYVNQFRLNQNDASLSSTVPTPTETDEQTTFDAYMLSIQDTTRPGTGSGTVRLATWDNWYIPGDRILGIRGGYDVSFEHGSTGHYPNVVQVAFDFETFTVELSLADLRRASIK